MPNFYKKVHGLITQRGFDSIIINRVDIPKVIGGRLIGPNNINIAYSYNGGLRHPGKDCFVFKRSIIPKMKLNNAFVGFAPIGTVIMSQIFKNTDDGKFLWLTNGTDIKNRMTFHIGRDLAHLSDDLSEYRAYNMLQSKELINKKFVISMCNFDLKNNNGIIL